MVVVVRGACGNDGDDDGDGGGAGAGEGMAMVVMWWCCGVHV